MQNRALIFVAVMLLLTTQAFAQKQNMADIASQIKCEKNFLKELDDLFLEYQCLHLGDSTNCNTGGLGKSDSRNAPSGSRKILKAAGNAKAQPNFKKIAEFLKNYQPSSAGAALSAGAAMSAKYIFKKLGGFYMGSILDSSPTADACNSEIHFFRKDPGDKVEVGQFVNVAVPANSFSCEPNFSLVDNKGLAGFYSLPSDKERLQVLSNKKVCMYYFGIREYLEDLIMAKQKAAAVPGAKKSVR